MYRVSQLVPQYYKSLSFNEHEGHWNINGGYQFYTICRILRQFLKYEQGYKLKKLRLLKYELDKKDKVIYGSLHNCR